MRLTVVAAALSLAFAIPAAGQTSDEGVVAQALTALTADPARAVRLVDPVIARSGAMTGKPGTDQFCSGGNVVAELFGKALQQRSAVAYDAHVCAAIFAKGFALIDLGRRAEAEPFLRRATELAPTDAHYLNEYAEWWKIERQWQKSYDLFARAAALAGEQPAEDRAPIHARSMRGMGFNLIELGRLDDAERLFLDSLKVEPDSPAALNELKYIAEQRAKIGAKPGS